MRSSHLAASAVVLAALSLTACRKDEIVTYRVVGESAPASAPAAAPATGTPEAPFAGSAGASADAMAQMANTAVPTASGPGLAWTAPAGWTTGPEKPMRKATLLVPAEAGGAGAELAITAFPGSVGSDLDNVNRWRQQLGLAPIAEAELGSAMQHIDVGALHIDVVEIAGGTGGQRTLTAIVPHAGAKWFFKLTGPDAVVQREKSNFLAFVQSIRPQG